MTKIFGVLIESVINAARNSVPRSMAQPLNEMKLDGRIVERSLVSRREAYAEVAPNVYKNI